MVGEFLQTMLQTFVGLGIAFGVQIFELRLDVLRFVDELVRLS